MLQCSHRPTIVVGLLVLSLIQSVLLTGGSASPLTAASYLPGVRVGDWWQSSILIVCTAFCPSQLQSFAGLTSLDSSVVDVKGTNVTLKNTEHFVNGTSKSVTVVQNVTTGQPGLPYYLLAANLTVGQPLYESSGSPTISSVQRIDLLGAERNVAQATSVASYLGLSYVVAGEWDQQTGILASANVTVAGYVKIASITLTATNIWKPPPDFGLNSAFPGIVTIPSDGTKYTLFILVNSISGFSGNVTLAALSNSSSLLAKLGSDIVKVASGSYAYANVTVWSLTLGSYRLNVTGSSGSITHSVLFQIRVENPSVGTFALTVGTKSLALLPGNSTTLPVSITSIHNFSGPVSLTVLLIGPSGRIGGGLNDPFGPQAWLNNAEFSLEPNQTSTTALNIETPNLPIKGQYIIELDAHGGLPEFDRYVNITMVIPGPDFALTMNPGSLSMMASRTGIYNVTVRSYGLWATVDLSVSSTPSGVECMLSDTSVVITGAEPLGNSTVTCRGSPGSYTVTVTGVSGSLMHSTNARASVVGSTPNPSGAPGFSLFGLPAVESYAAVAGLIVALGLASIGTYWRWGRQARRIEKL